MKTAWSIDTPHNGGAQHARAANLLSVAVDSTPLPLRQVLAQVEDLKRKLASSQDERLALQRRLDFVTNANAQLREFVVGRKQEVACGSRPEVPPPQFPDSWLSAGLDLNATEHIEHLLAKRRRYRKGDVIYHAGTPFKALYAICTGSCKTALFTKHGQDQVAGYHLAGEIIGFDGIGTDTHDCHAIALEDTEVCPLPFDQVENLARFSEQFGHRLHVLLSREGARTRALMIVLSSMRAEQRVAVFLLDLSRRYRERGYSSCEFVLRLTRQEIGSYLGLKLETVSRLLSRFQRDGLIQVRGRTVKLLDRVALSQLVDCTA